METRSELEKEFKVWSCLGLLSPRGMVFTLDKWAADITGKNPWLLHGLLLLGSISDKNLIKSLKWFIRFRRRIRSSLSSLYWSKLDRGKNHTSLVKNRSSLLFIVPLVKNFWKSFFVVKSAEQYVFAFSEVFQRQLMMYYSLILELSSFQSKLTYFSLGIDSKLFEFATELHLLRVRPFLQLWSHSSVFFFEAK